MSDTRVGYIERVSPRLRAVLDDSPDIRGRAERILSFFDADADFCYGPGVGIPASLRHENYVVTYHEGLRVKVSWRALVWVLSGRDLPPYGFTKTSCGVAGCVNPSHQRFAGARPRLLCAAE